jgi:hypothetical protein
LRKSGLGGGFNGLKVDMPIRLILDDAENYLAQRIGEILSKNPESIL